VRGEQAGRAAQAIEHFYARASGDLTLEDVQLGLVGFSKDNQAAKGDGPQLLTRRADLHGRTPHQVEYLEKIVAHDCSFGIGPGAPNETTSPSPASTARAR
jgi:phosphate starvation-inducible PhoH-like protein